MKTLSLKMLLVAALVVVPVVKADDKAPQTQNSYFNSAVETVSGAGAAIVAFPAQAWKEFSEAGILAKFAVLAATGYVGEKAYAYMNAPAKAKTVKA
jgi:hypothetical protein